MAWAYHNPVAVRFGVGALDALPAAIAGRPYALVSYGDDHFKALARRVVDLAGAPVAVIDDITPNPDFASLQGWCRALGRRAGTAIVALGGGSVIDAAKVLAASGGDFGAIRARLEAGSDAPLDPLPLIAVPTTAGTGSEVTRWATVWHAAAGKKYSLADRALFPETAIVDPALMLGLPRALTVATGLDALSHALESVWNRNANPVSANHAVAAATEILDVLPPLADDLGNLDLRTRMARAATMAGLAFSNTATALAHSLSYPITLRHGVPHGLACSFSLPMVMSGAIGVDDACDATLRRIFGADLQAGAEALARLLQRLGVSTDASAYGVDPGDWPAMIDDALAGARGLNYIGRREQVLTAVT